jgi:hypothetical protein
MTSTEIRLRSASAVAGYVRSVAAGVLMHGPLRSHRCGAVIWGQLHSLEFLSPPAGRIDDSRYQ